MDNLSSERPLRRDEAAEYVTEKYFKCGYWTLAKMATVGGGPLFSKAGKFPVYEIADLDAWAKSKISKKVRSTAELAAA